MIICPHFLNEPCSGLVVCCTLIFLAFLYFIHLLLSYGVIQELLNIIQISSFLIAILISTVFITRFYVPLCIEALHSAFHVTDGWCGGWCTLLATKI